MWKAAVGTEPEGGSKVEKTGGRRSGRPWPENGPMRRRRRRVMTVTMMMMLHSSRNEVPKFTDARKKGAVDAEIMKRTGVMHRHFGWIHHVRR